MDLAKTQSGFGNVFHRYGFSLVVHPDSQHGLRIVRGVLDLDDGVKVNYAKFGDLLACVKQVCGKDEED